MLWESRLSWWAVNEGELDFLSNPVFQSQEFILGAGSLQMKTSGHPYNPVQTRAQGSGGGACLRWMADGQPEPTAGASRPLPFTTLS